MKTRKIFWFLIMILLFTACSAVSDDSYRRVSTEEAMAIMAEEEDYIILDVRTFAEYESGHIPNAVCIPNESIGADVSDLLPDKDRLILVYCRSGNRSKQAAAKLADLGYTNVVEFGGINSWTGEIEQ